MTEGEVYGFVYIILSGSVKVFIRGKSGNELILGFYRTGDFLGEFTFFEDSPALTSAITLERTRVLKIPKEAIKNQAIQDSWLACYLLRKTTAQIRHLTERLGDLALTDVYDRVTKMLLNSAVQIEDALTISNPPSQQYIAGLVGASQAMVSKIFKELSIGGYIHISSDKITIKKRLPKSW
jgi:CRP-like cAMP-binding protein